MSLRSTLDEWVLESFGAKPGKKVELHEMKPGSRYILTFRSPVGMKIGTPIEFNEEKTRMLFAEELPPDWNSPPMPVLVQKGHLAAIYEDAVSAAAGKAAKALPRFAEGKLPPEMLGEVMRFFKPEFKGGPYPGTERQKAATKAALVKTRAEVPGDEELAVGRGRRKTRRRARKTTRRR